MRDFLPKNLIFVDKANRGDVLEDKKTKIIVTTSGMGSYGPAQVYIPEYISRGKALIQFTGFTAEGTLGSRLKNTKIGEFAEVGGMITKKNADEVNPKRVGLLGREYFFRVDPYGLVKTLSTKFK